MLKIKNPYKCPRANECSQFIYYKSAVGNIKNNQNYFLKHHEELMKTACNCPLQIEDGYWEGFLQPDEWLLYLKCDIFSDWFWKEAAKSTRLKLQEGMR